MPDSNQNLLTYENTSLGIEMAYPYNWDILEHGLTDPLTVTSFYSPLSNESDLLLGNINIAIETLPIKNMSLDKYTASNIEQLKILLLIPICISSN